MPEILVTGDVVVDHNIYIGERTAPVERDRRGRYETRTLGGAMLTYKLLEAIRKITSRSQTKIRFGLERVPEPADLAWPCALQCGALWEPFPTDGNKNGELVWRQASHLGYGGDDDRSRAFKPGRRSRQPERPEVIVVDDAGLGFRSAANRWPTRAQLEAARWIVLKMSRPLARGDLWLRLTRESLSKLIVIVSAEDLRREDVRIGRGLSWETTVESCLKEIDSNPALGALKSPGHLIVMMRGDGALWLERANNRRTLVFDHTCGEGESEARFNGNAFGYLSALTASVAWTAARAGKNPNLKLAPATQAGLSAGREIRILGHGKVKRDGKPAFPLEKIAEEITVPKHHFGVSEIASPFEGGNVSILESNCRPDFAKGFLAGALFGAARRLVLYGSTGLPNAPSARFGDLWTFDRREIEGLRTFRQLIVNYVAQRGAKQPLSLAVFGAPGSGKSFGVKEIAKGIFGEDNVMIEFNLSQFEGPAGLAGAFHQIRDHVVRGKTPVVFWDEFDSGEYKWLQYFLAPMLDGAFQDQRHTHAIGKSIFVFAGGTSHDFRGFGPPGEKDKALQEAVRRWDLLKGPDFRSRLAGYLDVAGPNRKGGEDDDIDFPVRRGLLIRAALKIKDDRAGADIDARLLAALLGIRKYKNGARSLTNLVTHIKEHGGVPLRRAYLPPKHLLEMHVDDAKLFYDLMDQLNKFHEQAKKLAPAVHGDWLSQLSVKEKRNNPNAKAFSRLPEEIQNSNIAAARRIPEILLLADLALEPGMASSADERLVARILEHEIEALANAEHEGWMKQKGADGWTFGATRDDANLKHPSLRPYAELPDSEKDKDRSTIREYPKYARLAGFRIAPVKVDPTG